MNIMRAFVLVTIFSLVTGCKVAVMVSSGGDVISQSGARDCLGPKTCEFEAVDATFDETFTAVANEGYVFSRWEKGKQDSRFLCKGSANPVCRVSNKLLTGIEIPIAAYGGHYYLFPIFVFVGIDSDDDGVKNWLDLDDDNDGVFDVDDLCPLDNVNEDGFGCPILYANTNSTAFQKNDYLDAIASSFSSTLGRSSNGSGATDAWTISTYFKPGTHTGPAKQSLLFFGGTDYDDDGHIWLYYKGSDGKIRMEYGSKDDNLEFTTSSAVVSVGSWTHLMVTYDGGTTGSSSGDINDYYSRFKIFIDGVEVSTNKAEDGNGLSEPVPSDIFRIGRRGNDNDWLKDDVKLDEMAVWDSDQSTNISTIYNGGVPHSLAPLGPISWWRLGDEDIHPTLVDSISGSDFTMHSMNPGSIGIDVP